MSLVALLAGMTFAAEPAWAADAFSEGRDAADAGDHKKALAHYQEAYDNPQFAESKQRIALWAVKSAAAARLCGPFRRWLKLMNRDDLSSSERAKLTARCATPSEHVTFQPVVVEPPAPTGGCKDGGVLSEDKQHCCPAGTKLNADKTLCVRESGTLIIDSNLSGALLSGVGEGQVFGPNAPHFVPATGFHVPRGEVKLAVFAGTYAIKLDFPRAGDLGAITREVVVPPGGEVRASFDWETKWRGNHERWVEFAATNRTPSSFFNAGGIGALLAGILILGGSATLYGTCGASINGSCDAVWQQGLSYTGATLGALFGVAFTIAGAAILGERRPEPFTDANNKPLP
jgi:hypothetical protein